MSKIYVLCPYGLVTGGPDALHQMVYYLNLCGYEAELVYTDIRSRKHNIPSCYQVYTSKYLLLKDIEDSVENSLVVPETETNLLSRYSNVKKYIWWLSVDNDIVSSGFWNKLKKIFSKIRLNNIKKLYKIFTLKNFLAHKRFDFEMDNIVHLCASYYAYDYVTKRDSKNKAFLCIEPISKIFLEKVKQTTNDKVDIILYNPKKNGKFVKKIIAMLKDYNFIPLAGYSQDELIELYSKAKVYIDFGSFPGAERIPKEAVLNGCCIVTGKFGASNFYADVPIKDEYKFDANAKNLVAISDKIVWLVKNYYTAIGDFSAYRNTVLKLEGDFKKQLRVVFGEFDE